jgi:hypothetical protein
MTNCTRLFLLVLLAATSAHAATLSGTVVDYTEAAIPDARVIIHWDSVGLDSVKENVGIKGDEIATTDATGHFSLELPPGVYDVFVAAAGFFPHCEKLSVKGKETRSYTVPLKVSRMLKTQLD